MTAEVIVGLLSLLGTAIGSLCGIIASSKLTNYRIAELEKKVDKHNQVLERFALLEQDNNTQWRRIDDMKETLERIREEMH